MKSKTKTVVQVQEYGISSSINFEKKIAKIINSKLNEFGYESADYITLQYASMRGANSYGQYFMFIEVIVNDLEYVISKYSTDSQRYDDIHNDENSTDYKQSNLLKKLTLEVLENGVERFVDELIDNEVVFKMEVSINKKIKL